jgi:5-methylcytosine-specific restriction endonuclease McrA
VNEQARPRSFWYDSWGNMREFYQWYKHTRQWDVHRRAALGAADFCCQQCGAAQTKTLRLEVDHKNYMRLGVETPADLQALCPTCHDRLTRNRRRTPGFPG